MWEWESMMPGVRYFAACVDDGGGGGRVDGLAEGRDFSVLDIDAAFFQVTVADGHDVGVGDDNVVVGVRGGLLTGCEICEQKNRKRERNPSGRDTMYWGISSKCRK